MLSLIRRSLHLAAGGRRWPWLLVVGLAVVVSLIEAAGAVLIFALVSLVSSQQGGLRVPVLGDVRPWLGGDDHNRVVVTAAALVGAFFVVRGCIVVGAAYVQARVTQSAGARLSIRLHEGYMAMPYSTYVRTNSSTHIRNITDTVQRVVTDVFVQGARLLSESVVMVVLAAMLIATSPEAMALLVLVVLPAVLAVNRWGNPRLTRLGVEAQAVAEENLRQLQESLQGLRDIRMLGRESFFVGSFARSRTQLAHNRTARAVLQQIPTATVETAFVLFLALFLAVTAVGGGGTQDVLPVVGMFAYVGLRLKPSLNQAITSVNGLRYSGAAIIDLSEDLQRSASWRVPADGGPPVGFEHEIRLDELSFSYADAGRPALTGVSLKIPRGASVGFVGPTGSGKSTLVDLLIGLLEPSHGRVLVDGVDIADRRGAWLQRLGVVPQTIFLVDDTLRRNIALGVSSHEIDEEQVLRAVSLAQLDGFVSRLPEGLDTVLGERGVRVSGGEKQRIGIARALYHQPDVLVLDEGTSALDNKTEAELMRAVEDLRGDYTVVLVAHRLSTVQRCDTVHVLEGGTVVASGTFDDLVATSQHFQRLTR
jgi:ATP-binding cassette subfamily C protein